MSSGSPVAKRSRFSRNTRCRLGISAAGEVEQCEEIERFEADVEGDELSLRVLKRELETSQA